MKSIEPEINKIKEEYKDNRQVQAQKMMDLYKEKGVNPFSSILLMFIQLPILFALYKVYLTGIATVNTEILYPFITAPVVHHTVFLGIFDITQKSYVLAFVAALTQFVQARIMAKSMTTNTPSAGTSTGIGQDFAKNMAFQMQYILPVVIFFISSHTASALALYWATSNIFMIIQELVVKKQIAAETNNRQLTTNN